jgi:hypothetical protein
MRSWYHGTTAELAPGEQITSGHTANFQCSHPRRVYFTADAAWAATYAVNVSRDGGEPHLYEVSPIARRTFHDFSLVGGVADRHARWSCQPLTVIRELPVDLPILAKVGRLITRMEQALDLAETALR